MSEVLFNLGPYSHILVTLPEDGDPVSVAQAGMYVAEALQEWFNGYQENTAQADVKGSPDFPDDPGPMYEQPIPERPEQPRYGAGSPVETREQMLARSWGNCPDCGAPSRPSKMQYQRWDTTDDGVEVPASHFCTNQACPRPKKSLWRRELVPA